MGPVYWCDSCGAIEEARGRNLVLPEGWRRLVIHEPYREINLCPLSSFSLAQYVSETEEELRRMTEQWLVRNRIDAPYVCRDDNGDIVTDRRSRLQQQEHGASGYSTDANRNVILEE